MCALPKTPPFLKTPREDATRSAVAPGMDELPSADGQGDLPRGPRPQLREATRRRSILMCSQTCSRSSLASSSASLMLASFR